MGTAHTPKGHEPPDAHARIRADAAALNATPGGEADDASNFPDLAELVQAVRVHLADALPRFVHWRGRNYWIRAHLVGELKISAQPVSLEPLVSGVLFSSDEHGRAPLDRFETQ